MFLLNMPLKDLIRARLNTYRNIGMLRMQELFFWGGGGGGIVVLMKYYVL